MTARPAPAIGPSGTASDASGVAALCSTTARSAKARPYAMRASGRATSSDTAPAAAVAAPATISGGDSGTAVRVAGGEIKGAPPQTGALGGNVGRGVAGAGPRARRLKG